MVMFWAAEASFCLWLQSELCCPRALEQSPCRSSGKGSSRPHGPFQRPQGPGQGWVKQFSFSEVSLLPCKEFRDKG